MKNVKKMSFLLLIGLLLVGCSSNKEPEPKKETTSVKEEKKEENKSKVEDEWVSFEFKNNCNFTVDVPFIPEKLEDSNYKIPIDENSFILIGDYGSHENQSHNIGYGDVTQSFKSVIPGFGQKIVDSLYTDGLGYKYYENVIEDAYVGHLVEEINDLAVYYSKYKVMLKPGSGYQIGVIDMFLVNGYSGIETTSLEEDGSFTRYPFYIVGVSTVDDEETLNKMNSMLDRIGKSYKQIKNYKEHGQNEGK